MLVRRTGRRAGEYFEQILWLRRRRAGLPDGAPGARGEDPERALVVLGQLPALAISSTPAIPVSEKIGMAVVTSPSLRVAHGVRRARAASARCCQVSSP